MNKTIKKRIEEINNGIVPEGYEKTSFGIFPCDWEKDKSLGDICEINPKTEALPNEFIYIDLESVVDGKLIQENVIENAKAPSRAQRVLQKNDIIYQMVRPYQKNNFIFIQDDGSFKYVASTGYAQLRSDNYVFLYQMVNCEYFCTQVLKKCTGTNYPAINSQDLAEVNCAYPKDEQEQSRIAEILMQWDKAIELQEKLIEAYQKSKKYYLNKMFPKKGSNIPEIRFPGFTAPWEQRKLGDLGKAQSGIGFPDKEQGGKTGIPFFKVSDMNNVGNEFEMNRSNNYVSPDQIKKNGWFPIEETSVIFAKVGAAIMLNRKRLVRFPFLLDNNTMAYKFSDAWDIEFGRTLFERIDLTSLVQVGALPSYNASDVENMEVAIPQMAEQYKLGALFKSLDNLITLHQQKRDKLLKQRKAMQQYLLTGIVRV